VQPTGRARIALRLLPLDQAVSRASLAQASINTVVPPTTHLPLGHRHTWMSARPFIGFLSRRILSTVQRPVRGTACGRAGFTGGSPAVSHTNMLRRILRVVWERRRLTSGEEQWHGHRGHDKFIGQGQ
jgi:hypothetical protein